jgi:DNA mismatch repair protein MutL
MPRIRILPDILANKIAAGEVVERPAAVVKELVENALDADAGRIVIDIENGGRTLIQVADNGVGMGHDDALLATERFATSKLRTDADLMAIRTLGFRGEALPSIAAVSKLTLITREQGAAGGVQVRIEAGKILQVTETGAPRGTLVRVAQLFFNTPARRKFLKTVNTEMGHIADTVSGMALAYPEVHFSLTHNAKAVKQWPRVTEGVERAADVLGPADPCELTALDDGRDGSLRLTGWIAPARLARNTSRGTFFFVNGRRVRDRTIQHALFEGFHGRLMKGRFPLAVLFLNVPFDQVDVNVHPTKHEVRFADQRSVHDLVRTGVTRALEGAERRLWAVAPPRTSRGMSYAEPDTDLSVADMHLAEPDTGYSALRPLPPSLAEDAGHHEDIGHDTAAAPTSVQTEARNSLRAEASPPQGLGRDDAAPAPVKQQSLWGPSRLSDLTVIGQFHGTYLICQDGDDMVLIDQHAAHERVVFEALGRRLGRVESQRLLLPETIEVGFAEARALEPFIDELHAMGLEIEPFGGNTFAVKAIPSRIDPCDIADLVRELAQRCLEIGLNADLDQAVEACRMVMACHKAVRAKQQMSAVQIRRLLEELEGCRNPNHCPHGRPTMIRWPLRDIEKAFGRISFKKA